MTDLTHAARVVADLLHLLSAKGDLELTAKVTQDEAPGAIGGGQPELTVELSGADTSLVIDRNGELLYAIEHLAAKVLRLEPEEHDRISFDAANFKADRDHALRQSAETAIAAMRQQAARPYTFAPMTSRERRLLHLLIAPSGLQTASTGMGPGRAVVVYPEGVTPPAEAPTRFGSGPRYSQPATPNGVDPRRRPRGFSPR